MPTGAGINSQFTAQLMGSRKKRIGVGPGRKYWQFNPTLHGLFQAGSTRGREGGGVTGWFSETVKATAIKLGTLTN